MSQIEKVLITLEDLVYTTREAAFLLGIIASTTIPTLKKWGLAPVHKFGKSQTFWLKTDIEALKIRLEGTKPQQGVESGAHRAERLKHEFFELYGCYPYQRPDLVSQWCDLLGKAV